jgi:hypothetical protein
VNNVIEHVPEDFRDMFIEVLGERDSALLSALYSQERPTAEQREGVDDIFSDEIVRELGPGHVPTARGQLVKRAIEEFWYHWGNETS